MNHQEVRKRLGDYLQGDLTLAQRALLDGHLDGCARCAEELRALRETIHLLRNLPPPATPSGLADRVMARVEAGEAEPRGWDRPVRWLRALQPARLAAPLAGAAVAAAAALLVVRGESFQVTISLPGQPGVAERAARAPDAPAPPAEAVARAPAAPAPRLPGPGAPVASTATASPGALPAPASRPMTPAGELRVWLETGDETFLLEPPGLEWPFGARADREGLHAAAATRTAPGSAPADALALALQDPSAFVARFQRMPAPDARGWLAAVAERAVRERSVGRVARGLRESGGPEGAALAARFEGAARNVAADR